MIQKLFCFFGFHQWIELVDKDMSTFIGARCVYSQCKFCGKSFDTRTIGIKIQLTKPEQPK